MKFFIKVYVVFMLLFCVINAHDLRTPNGNPVNHTHPTDTGWEDGSSGWHTAEYWTTFADNYWRSYFIERIDRANKAYNCHSYAWAGSRQANPASWCSIETNSDVSAYWTDESYIDAYPTPFDGQSNATHINYTGTLEQQHSLLVESGNIVTSKWGKYPCYKHYLYSDPSWCIQE